MSEEVELETRSLGERTVEQRLRRAGASLTFDEVLEGWATDPAVREATLRAIAGAPFSALFWEVAPMTPARLADPYTHVLVDSPELGRVTADRRAFEAQLHEARDVVSFDNLGGDARLVVPTARVAETSYAHLARAVREAPSAQMHALLERVGIEVRARLESRAPVWLSTAGLGVYWLHVRLDSRPKYYSHRPYRTPPSRG